MGLGVVRPGGYFVEDAAGLEATVEYADQSVADLSQGGVVATAGALISGIGDRDAHPLNGPG
jgi:hypothetical protein